MGGSKFHYPVGQPGCPGGGAGWRVGLLEKGLAALETPVKEPKVF